MAWKVVSDIKKDISKRRGRRVGSFWQAFLLPANGETQLPKNFHKLYPQGEAKKGTRSVVLPK